MMMKNKTVALFSHTFTHYCIQWLTLLSPTLAARFVNYRWFKTQRYPEAKREQRVLAKAAWQTIRFQKETVQIYSWGDTNQPTVLLVHGWNGRGAQLGSFVEAVLKQGCRVIAFDAPAHGRSSAKSTNLLEMSLIIQQLSQQYGPIKAAISHSLGGLCLLHAISAGSKIDKAVCIASAFNIDRLVTIFAKKLAVKPRVIARQKELLERQFGSTVWDEFSMPHLVKKTPAAGLLIHDEYDKAIPVERSKLTAQDWPDSELVVTSGLGHRRILRDKEVISKVMTFIMES